MSPVESGVRSLRAEFIRETTEGETPTNPAWLRFSDSFQGLESGFGKNIFTRRAVGDADPAGFHGGASTHELTLSYYLQRWIDAATKDASYDGLTRLSDGGYRDPHSVLVRQDVAEGGALGAGFRVYAVGQGGKINNASLEGEPESGEPIQTQLDYLFEKLRTYRIAQPSGASTVDVKSTDAGDTTQSVTIEDEGAGTSETLALNGTTLVSGITSFSDIDSISLDAETKGDVVIEIGGTEISRIRGTDSYDPAGVEGDLGVPPLGSGSHEAALGTRFESIIGDTIQRGGADLDENVLSLSITVANNIEATARHDSFRRRLSVGTREISVEATVFGESSSHDQIVEHLMQSESDIVWTLTGGVITIGSAVLMEPGQRNYTAGAATMQRGNTFVGQSLTLS